MSGIKRCCTRDFSSTDTPLSKKAAYKFLEGLEISNVTKNKHADKVGSFFKWLDAREDVSIRIPFEGMRYKHNKSASEQRVAYTKLELNRLLSIAKSLPLHR